MQPRHDDAIKWKHFLCYLPFVRGIRRSTVNSPHKGQWRGALVFSLICAWTNGRLNNRYAGDLLRHRTHYAVRVMTYTVFVCLLIFVLSFGALVIHERFKCLFVSFRCHDRLIFIMGIFIPRNMVFTLAWYPGFPEQCFWLKSIYGKYMFYRKEPQNQYKTTYVIINI